MKLLTLNAHSLIENDYERKLEDFVSAVLSRKPDIIALQEVNQTAGGVKARKENLKGYFPCQNEIQVTEDNHAYKACRLLARKNVFYYWTWLPIKNGYEEFDEGLAVLSLKPIIETDSFLVSKTDDYRNWKTRKTLGILTEDINAGWFYSVHLSWWNDEEEPFSEQWEKLEKHLSDKERVWIMGDFNNPAEIRNEGYDKIKNSGWYDTYEIAVGKDGVFTVDKVIDGWKDKISSTEGMRIDHIWTKNVADIKSSEIIFDGVNEPVVSDHFGVMTVIEED